MNTPTYAIDSTDTFPTLPDGCQRSDVVRVLATIAPRIGLKSGPLRVLLSMIHMTPPKHWKDPTADAVCYREQTKVAAKAGVSTRTVRAHEDTLETLGLITKRTGANGSRGRFAKGSIIQGISFSPLIALFPNLVAIEALAEETTQRAEVLRRKCSAARRSFKTALEDLLTCSPKHPELTRFLRIQAELPRRYDGMAGADLEQLLALVDKATRDALDTLSHLQESTAAPEENCRPHIHATTNTPLESCSGSSAMKRSGRMRPEASFTEAAPVGASKGNEKEPLLSERGHKPAYTDTFPPEQLYRMAGDGMQMYLDFRRRPGKVLSPHDFIQAAIDLVPAHGIGLSAWDEAREVMGDFAAALCVLVIDANIRHPDRPIRSPGGALRTFTGLASIGKFNLHGSLIGLKQRLAARSEICH
jgi:replication initiation protein RepC